MSNSKTGIKLTTSLVGLVVVLIALGAANYIIGHVHARLDLTKDKLYSLSGGTRAILSKLDRPVTLKLFFSRSSPQVPSGVKDYIDKVSDLLEEYRKASAGKVTIEVYDTKEDSDAEELAQKYGIPGQRMGQFGPSLYMGLVAFSAPSEAMIPVLDPGSESLLEYSITKLVYQVAHPQKPSIGVLSSFPVLGGPPAGMRSPMAAQPEPPWLVFKELQSTYNVVAVPPTTDSIDPMISSLIVIHPKELSDKTLYAIDQFVLRGGRLLAFVDPLSVVDFQDAQKQQQNPYGMPPDAKSDLKKLFAAWGVGYESSMIMADLKAGTMLGQNESEENPGWLTLSKKNMDASDVMTANLESMSVPFAGSLVNNGVSNDLTFIPLLTTSPESGIVDTHSVMGGKPLQNLFKPGGKALVLAARLDGIFHTAFPNGPGPADGETNAPALSPSHLNQGKSSVFIVADSDIVFQGFSVREQATGFGFNIQQPLNDNLNFVMNAVEKMSGSLDLITVRCRGSFARPFDRVEALRNEASTRWSEEERRLMESKQEVSQQLQALESKKDKSQRFILSDEQKKAIEQYQAQEREINVKLKQVKKSLTQDIDRLGTKVKVINILLMPCVVVVMGGVVAMRRRNSR